MFKVKHINIDEFPELTEEEQEALSSAALYIKSIMDLSKAKHENKQLRRALANPCRFPTTSGPCGQCEACIEIQRLLDNDTGV